MDNQRKVVLYVATSLDGYIATKEESLEWLFKIESEGDAGYSQFYETVDTILMGRRTYDWIMAMEKGKFPYENKECYVFSNTLNGKTENVEFVNEEVVSFTTKLKSEAGKDIWIVGGGELLHLFLLNKLVDEYVITIAPTLIGKGIPLFKEADYELELELIDVKRFNQFAQIHFVTK
ncbi:dihydrofolate reductase family protein [Pseudoneobacillus rhizosphaerae]|uniref:IS1595 family transposase ISCac2 n=1 Tax=Pseudoneobacillus rhizosphaerae TaxID=2880968 RepID=A0A9C7LAJ2_9BACI|nr:dihydrofolate reductase family protein [Pseudoneobacillus rhizosphaerae]CAG9607530.1 IS1595 family transposase ISCac2 [Pseudoneobacillus rhizosphaerae]